MSLSGFLTCRSWCSLKFCLIIEHQEKNSCSRGVLGGSLGCFPWGADLNIFLANFIQVASK